MAASDPWGQHTGGLRCADPSCSFTAEPAERWGTSGGHMRVGVTPGCPVPAMPRDGQAAGGRLNPRWPVTP